MKKRQIFLTFALAIVVRLIAGVISHPWDIQTFYNFFVDLAKNVSPYETMRYLSSLARLHSVSGWDYNFEYFAYPPLIIFIYTLPAKIYALLHPSLDYNFVISHASPVISAGLDFSILLKLPVYLADLGIGYLLYKHLDFSRAKSFLFNPYIILVSIWTFDSIMTFFLLSSVIALSKEKYSLSSVLLALGALTKFVPLFVFPSLLIYLIKKGVNFRQLLFFVLGFASTILVFVLPYLDGVKFVLDFHNSRVGGGLTPQLILQQLPYYLSNNFINFEYLIPIYHFLIPQVSTFIFLIGMLFIYYLTARFELTLNQSVIISLLGYLIFNKIINEQYVFILIPFLLFELGENYSQIKQFVYNLLWALPFAFTVVNVSILGFFFPVLHNLGIDDTQLRLYADFVTGSSIRLMFLRGTAVSFSLLCVYLLYYLVSKTKQTKVV